VPHADLQRPAAIEQLHVIGKQVGVGVFSKPGENDPVKVCREGFEAARLAGANVVILDTAGRLAIDAELMEQLKQIDRAIEPTQVLLVVDGMTGQDAVNSAKAFNDALSLDGVIMTKLDGDARGGALISVKAVTSVPIKFIGTGEHLDALEPFRPEGMASRILSMGDIVEVAREAHRLIDEKERKSIEERMAKGVFTLADFRDMMQKLRKPGLMTKMLGDGRCEGQLLNGQSTMVMAHIRGKMKKRVFIHTGDVVLVGLRDFQEGKVDIIHKYTSDEAKNLVHLGEIAELSESRTCKDIDISSSHEEKEKTGDDNFVDIDFEKI
jgi:signal recognition particle subunit SRP54